MNTASALPQEEGDPFSELLAYVRFGEADAARLRALLPIVQPRLAWLTDNFYAAVRRSPGASAILHDPAQVERLKMTLQRWIVEMLTGPYDREYHARRLRIGVVHVRVKLPEHYVFAAMNLLRQDLCEIAHRSLPADAAWETCTALVRITDVELSIMSAAYLDAHEEQRLRSLQHLIVENLPVTVLCLDEAGRVTAATRPSARLFGGQAQLGRHYQAFLPAELIEAADLPTHVGQALSVGNEVSVPRAVLGTGAEERHFRITLVPLEHPLARLLIHVEELTDVVQTEARLQQSEHLARIGSLAANIAHEIRNPLAAISATLQVIGGSLAADDRRKPVLAKVQDQVFRLDRLVTDLLGYARPAVARLSSARLSELAAEALAQSGVHATLVGRSDLAVLADTQYVNQILVNLLQNARDAAGERPIRVILGQGPRVIVADDGEGVPPDVVARLFEPFVTTKTRGTGLGLAISRKLAESMGGRLTLEQKGHPGGCGAVFSLQLQPFESPSQTSPDDTEAHNE